MPRPAGAPSRVLTDWTTSAGVDGTGLLALVTGGATAEGIHLATLGYEVLVQHADQASAADAEAPAHVHHVAIDLEALPPEWTQRFGLVVALDGAAPIGVVAAQGLLVVVADEPVEVPGLTHVVTEEVRELDQVRYRTVLVRLD